MNAYVTYVYYIDEYGGDMPEVQFKRQAVRASMYIDKITFDRIKALGEVPEGVKFACCEMSEALYAYDTAKVDGKDVQSVSNAGYSVTFTSGSDTGGGIAGKLYELAELYIPAHLLSMCAYDEVRWFDE